MFKQLHIYLFLFLTTGITFVSFAQDVVIKRSAVVETYKGKPYFVHFIQPGETLREIAKVYQVTVDEIITENPVVQSGLLPDMALRIPARENLLKPIVQPVTETPVKQQKKVEETQIKSPKPAVQPVAETPVKQQKKVEETQIKSPKPAVQPVAETPVRQQKKVEETQKKSPKPAVQPVAETPVKQQQKVEQTPDKSPKPAVQPFTEQPINQLKQDIENDPSIYLVKKKQTWYGISKEIHCTMEELMNANPGVTNLQEGMGLKIPDKKAVEPSTPKPVKPTRADTVTPYEITIKTGETLYSLSKLYKISVDELIDLNPQLSDGLKAGMVLKLRKSYPGEKVSPSVPDAGIKTGNKPGSEKQELSSLKNKALCYDPENLKKTYNIALLLPFELEKASDAIDAADNKDVDNFECYNYFQFYAGFLLAADSLAKFGLHANIQVLDADKLNDTLVIRGALRKQGIDKSDLLIGPLYASSFNVAARFAKKNHIGIVNPLSRRKDILESNPFVFKVQPSPMAIATALVQHIIKNYEKSQVIIVRHDNKDLNLMADYFTRQLKAKKQEGLFSSDIREVSFSKESMAGVTKNLKSGTNNVVLFFSNHNVLVPNFVSLLDQQAKTHSITLIGMDGWDDLDLETEFLVNLNYEQVSTSFVDFNSEEVKEFVNRFQANYGAVPQVSKQAFLGYDLGWYFLTSLMWYGKDFITCIPFQDGKGLEHNFKFSAGKDGNGLENQDVQIIGIQDYKFVRKD